MCEAEQEMWEEIVANDRPPMYVQACRGCDVLFPYRPHADYCPKCAAENAGEGEEF